MFLCTNMLYGFWWIVPIVMVIMMASCFFLMRRHKGPMMMCRHGSREGSQGQGAPESKMDILNKRVPGRDQLGRREEKNFIDRT